jgi:predicted O-linked N-acetylglucosamine transferase (SPINDLY family)
LTRIQYRISDHNCDPPGLTDRLHTEELVRLPHSQWCYRPFVTVDVPGTAHETNGFVTFGSFAQIAKLTPRMLSLWARILQNAPDSRLAIAGVPEGRIRPELLEALARDGVDSSRVTLAPFVQGQAYFRSFDRVDIALDTSPYSGGTTTCDALWMGVPVLTMPGLRPTSRSATSILATMGLTDWIATSPEDYVRRAVQFASERETIVGLRRSLRERMHASPLMQEARFARDMEQAYRAMWRRWCSGEPG